MRVHVVGSVKVPEGSLRRVTHRQASKVAPDMGGDLLVCDRSGLRLLAHGDVVSWLRNGQRQVIVCAEDLGARDVESWRHVAGCKFIAPEGLTAVIDEFEARFRTGLVRIPMAPEEWLGCALPVSATAMRAVELLPTLRCIHDCKELATAVGVRTGSLHAALTKALGFGPTRLYQRNLLAQVARCDELEISRARAAIMLGYADPSALAHALLRAMSEAAVSEPSRQAAGVGGRAGRS